MLRDYAWENLREALNVFFYLLPHRHFYWYPWPPHHDLFVEQVNVMHDAECAGAKTMLETLWLNERYNFCGDNINY